MRMKRVVADTRVQIEVLISTHSRLKRDARRMRGDRPFVFTNLKTGHGLDFVIRFIETEGLLGNLRPAA